MSVVLVVVVLFLLFWDVLWWGLGVTPVLPGQLKRLLQVPEGERPVLVDVRTKFEYDFFSYPRGGQRASHLSHPAAVAEHRQGRAHRGHLHVRPPLAHRRLFFAQAGFQKCVPPGLGNAIMGCESRKHRQQ